MNIRQEQRGKRVQWVLEVGYLDGKRVREYFTTERAAKARRAKLNKDKTAVGRYWSSLPPEKQRETALTLMQMSAKGVTLAELWAAYERGEVAAVKSVPMPQALKEMLAAKQAANRTARYVSSLRQSLKPFGDAHRNLLASEVTQAHVEQWLASRKVSAWTLATDRQRIETLFAFCLRRKWCAANPATDVERISTDSGPPRILTIEEARRMLTLCREYVPKLLPWIVLGLFAGCRPEEADKLEFADIDNRRGLLRVSAPGKRTRQRYAPLTGNALEWLALGGSLPVSRTTRRRLQRVLRELMGWSSWPQDVLRHTAASHFMARVGDAGKVADWLGNSPKVLLAHYRDLVPPEDAEAFVKILPALPMVDDFRLTLL